MHSPSEAPSAAYALTGLVIDNQWEVLERLPLHTDDGRPTFSVGYRVRDATGRMGFCKALDYASAMEAEEPADALNALTGAYKHERDLLTRCGNAHPSRVVRALAAGSLQVVGFRPPTVQYLIFEWAEGDVRKALDEAEGLAPSARLRLIHQVTTGIAQLHRLGIAHQDLKPSNVLSFSQQGRPVNTKVSDLSAGRDHLKGSPYDAEAIAGDPGYAPPELLYDEVSTSWALRSLACDAYLLGSLASFLIAGAGMTALLASELAPSLHWANWHGDYVVALPAVEDAFGRAMSIVSESAAAALHPQVHSELVQLVRALCEPDPLRRGHPKSPGSGAAKYDLQRFVTAFDRLATRQSIAERTTVSA